MIGNLVINVVVWFLGTIINFFPASDGFPPEAFTAVGKLGGYFDMFSPLIPMDTLLTVLTILFTVEIAVFGFRTLKWILSHLPFIGGRG